MKTYTYKVAGVTFDGREGGSYLFRDGYVLY